MSDRCKHFTLEKRISIAGLRQAGRSYWQIAAALDRSPSSIAREVKRNAGSGATARYDPSYADDAAWSRRWSGSRLERDHDLRAIVLERLAAGWPHKSPNPIQNIKNRASIHQKPACAQTRQRLGHWEADLLHPQKSGGGILVASEQKSRYTLLAKLDGKHAKPVASQLVKWLEPMPKNRKRSLTQDNGTKLYVHTKLNDIGIPTYFCDPHKPRQKGSA